MTFPPEQFPAPILTSNFVGEREAAGVSAEPSETANEAKPVPATATAASPLLGTSAMPVHIRVQRNKDTGYFSRFLNNLQIVVTIVFLVFLCFSLYRLVSSTQEATNPAGLGGAFVPLSSNVKFADIQGCEEVKAQLEQIVDFLRSPEKYERFGAEIPRGALLQGPPGVGKTMLAKAVAGEAQVPFFSVSGSEFDEVFVGVGAARVRQLFKAARMHERAVIFIDEIDAVGGKRQAFNPSGSRQTLNQLLVEMDGFGPNLNGNTVIVLAATNSAEILDPALLRPGRFDRTLSLHLPDIGGRTAILNSMLKRLPVQKLASDVSAEAIARITIGFSGADLAQVVNQAKLFAALDKSAAKLTDEHLRRAVQFVQLGPERRLAMKPSERATTAYHEAGHAVVALATDGAMPVQGATIVPHGQALGMVLVHPDEDFLSMTKRQLQAMIDVAFGGFVAEEIRGRGVDAVTTGPASDLATVNRLAREMVKCGFGRRTRFLQPPSDSAAAAAASEALKQGVEQDVQEILDEAKKRVTALLTRERDAWYAIAQALLERETLSRNEIYAIWDGAKSPAAAAAAAAVSVKSANTLKSSRKKQTRHDETDSESL